MNKLLTSAVIAGLGLLYANSVRKIRTLRKEKEELEDGLYISQGLVERMCKARDKVEEEFKEFRRKNEEWLDALDIEPVYKDGNLDGFRQKRREDDYVVHRNVTGEQH